jgi:hypothetical protein
MPQKRPSAFRRSAGAQATPRISWPLLGPFVAVHGLQGCFVSGLLDSVPVCGETDFSSRSRIGSARRSLCGSLTVGCAVSPASAVCESVFATTATVTWAIFMALSWPDRGLISGAVSVLYRCCLTATPPRSFRGRVPVVPQHAQLGQTDQSTVSGSSGPGCHCRDRELRTGTN